MARKRFNKSFENPPEESHQSTETENAPDDVGEFADQQAGTPRPDNTGKVAAVISVFVLLAGVVGLGAVVISNRNRVPLKIESIVESVAATNGCEWQLAIELRNNSDKPFSVERIAAVLNRGRRSGTMQEQGRPLAPGETGTYLVGFRLPDSDGCPAADEINHGNLIFHLDDGSSRSVRF